MMRKSPKFSPEVRERAVRMVAEHQAEYESQWAAIVSICGALQIAPSGYWRHAARRRTPSLRSARSLRDEALVPHIQRVWDENLQVYGADKVWRPNQLWVSDFTYVSTWQGWLYVAFVVDVFARRIVGWRVSTSMGTGFVLNALEQALYARQPGRGSGSIHHRLLEPLGYIPPAEAEANYYRQPSAQAVPA